MWAIKLPLAIKIRAPVPNKVAIRIRTSKSCDNIFEITIPVREDIKTAQSAFVKFENSVFIILNYNTDDGKIK